MRLAARAILVAAIAVGFVIAASSTRTGSEPDPAPEAERTVAGPEPGRLVDSALTTGVISLSAEFDDELAAPATPAARYVILRDDVAGGAPDLGAIRRANPGAQILLYKDAAFTVWDPAEDGLDAAGEPLCPFAPYQGTGVDYCTADANEEWFLHDADSPDVRLISSGFGAQWAMDPGNRGYQGAWIDSVLSRLRDADRDGDTSEGIDDRFDGVFMDDVNLRPGHGLGSQGIEGMPPADPESPDGINPAYRSAMRAFVDRVSNQIQDSPEGFITLANADADIYDAKDRAAALAVARDLDGYVQERYLRLYAEDEATSTISADVLVSEPATESAADWSDSLDFMREVQRTGASYVGITYGRDAGPNDVRAQRFVRASFLLGWDGSDGGALIYRSLDDTDGGPLGLTAWTESVGFPEGKPLEVGGAYRREFSAGVVVVNPALEGTAEIKLGGRYERANGTCKSTVALGPGTGAVMRECTTS